MAHGKREESALAGRRWLCTAIQTADCPKQCGFFPNWLQPERHSCGKPQELPVAERIPQLSADDAPLTLSGPRTNANTSVVCSHLEPRFHFSQEKAYSP